MKSNHLFRGKECQTQNFYFYFPYRGKSATSLLLFLKVETWKWSISGHRFIQSLQTINPVFLETDSNNNNTEKLTLDFMKCINMRTNQEKNIRLETKSCRILPLTYRKKYDMT